MRAASTETPRDNELWMQAIKAKWDGEGKFDKEDWDQLLGHCQAVCDLPAAAFASELIAAYPKAKVILTIRDPDSWHKYAPLPWLFVAISMAPQETLLADTITGRLPRQFTKASWIPPPRSSPISTGPSLSTGRCC